jgi:hypothetical protein
MQRRLNRIFLPLFFIALFSLAVEARADGLVITGGNTTQTISGHTFDFISQGFRANGWGYFGRIPCSPCNTSISTSLFDAFAGEDGLKYGPATFNGTDYQQLYYTGQIRFSSDLFNIPEDSPIGEFTLTVPFAMTGNLNGYLLNPVIGNPGPAVFSLELSGQGTASLLLYGLDTVNGRIFFTHGLTYNFQTTPTPEPATIFLLGSGLAGVAMKCYRRRKCRKQDQIS